MDTGDPLERARFLASRGRFADARSVLDAVLAEEPHHAEALLLKARVLLDSRDDEAALALYERAASTVPRSVEAVNGLARCLHILGRDAEALEVARKARDLLTEGENFRQTAPVYLTMVWCLRSMRQLREALTVAEEGLERTPDSVLAQWASVVEEELAELEPDQF